MRTFLKRLKSKINSHIYWLDMKRKDLIPVMGSEQIAQRGHRAYVGGKWDILGKLQLEFMSMRGLTPNHTLYDIGCGSLRAGVHFVNYLDTQKYFGIDAEADLIDLGIHQELCKKVMAKKKPEFVVSNSFEFDKFTKKPEYAIAQSLFTHLTIRDIKRCLIALRKISETNCQFYATFDEEGKTPKPLKREGQPNPPWSHSNLSFYYHFDDIKRCGKKSLWNVEYIGDWGHPSHQQMVLFWI